MSATRPGHVTVPTMTAHLPARVEARLTRLAALEPGWLDGEGEAITPEAIAAARDAGRLFAGAGIFPIPEGGVQLEWGHSGPIYWSLCINPDGRTCDVHGLVVGPDGKATDEVHYLEGISLNEALVFIDNSYPTDTQDAS